MDRPANVRELHGRLQLWILAMTECCQLLGHAKRARARRDRQHPPPTEIDEAYEARPFGTWWDLDLVANNYVLLATVIFGQVFTRGDAHVGRAHANQDEIAKEELELLLLTAFPITEEHAKFEALKWQLLELRHKAIAHADAKEFGISHGQGMVVSASYRAMIPGIDLVHFAEVVERIRAAIDARMARDGLMHGWHG